MSRLTIYLLTSWVLIFFILLPIGSCKKTVNQKVPTEEKPRSDILSPTNWNSWEPASNSGGMSWSMAYEPDPVPLIPLGLKEKDTQHSAQTKNHHAILHKADDKESQKAQRLEPEEFIGGLRKKLFTYGGSLLKFVTGLDSKAGFGLQNVFLDSESLFTNRQSEGKTEGRGVVDWLARLIGVQGKSLGEFLREYQVHVLYDLVFTFFKWVFFLYAGLLIP